MGTFVKAKEDVDWWEGVLIDYPQLIDWLEKQYIGELKAGERMREVFGWFDLSEEDAKAVEKVASEEDLHAYWFAELLGDRNIAIEDIDQPATFWEDIKGTANTLEEAGAIAYLAEKARLTRMEVIADCKKSPHDVKLVVKRVLHQEIQHASVFIKLTTNEEVARQRKLFGDQFKELE